MVRHSRRGRHLLVSGLTLLLFLALTACQDDDADGVQLVEDNPAGNEVDPEDIDTVEELVAFLASEDRDELRGIRVELDVWINPPPTTSGVSSTPPAGCPVVPEKQDWLSDDPVDTQIELAGAEIPNERLAEGIPMLRLVVPYQLGFVEIPDRATLRGQVLDEQHAGCPNAESLFILEEVVAELPADRAAEDAEIVTEWEQLTSEHAGIVLEYPAGWDVEQQESGVSARYRFLGPDGFRTIRIEVQEGETWWHPDADGGNPPDVLSGDRQYEAFAGQAHARLVDDRRRTSSDEREVRLVFNHQGNTVSIAMVIRDGADLDADSVWVFSEVAYRMHLQGDVAMSDPMDPILVAREEVGDGPFLSEADARYVAVNASGMTQAEAIEAALVSERDARTAVPGACHNFDGRPDGVWLVTVGGITQSGSDAHRIVYLDATNGNRLCQADAPGVS